MTENQNAKSKQLSARKKKVAIWNRRLAWVTLPMFLTGTVSYYLAVWQIYPDLKTFAGISSLVFILLFFAHSLFSVYLFGFPKFKRQIRVVHLYIGYVLFVFTLVSNSLIGLEPYHIIAYIIMWMSLIAHISLSVRFFLRRRSNRLPDPELSFFTVGNLLRDATTEGKE